MNSQLSQLSLSTPTTPSKVSHILVFTFSNLGQKQVIMDVFANHFQNHSIEAMHVDCNSIGLPDISIEGEATLCNEKKIMHTKGIISKIDLDTAAKNVSIVSMQLGIHNGHVHIFLSMLPSKPLFPFAEIDEFGPIQVRGGRILEVEIDLNEITPSTYLYGMKGYVADQKIFAPKLSAKTTAHFYEQLGIHGKIPRDPEDDKIEEVLKKAAEKLINELMIDCSG